MSIDDDMDRQGTAPVATLGETFRAARQSRGEDLDAVAAKLRIRRSLLAALEDGGYAELPGPAYTVGFVKTYAAYLGLDAGAAVERYKEETDGRTQSALVFKEPPEPARLPGLGTVLAALIVAALGAGAWALYAREGGETPGIADIPPRLMAMLRGEDAPASAPAAPGADGSPASSTAAGVQETVASAGDPSSATPDASAAASAGAAPRRAPGAPAGAGGAMRTAPAGDGGPLTAVLPPYGTAEGRVGAGVSAGPGPDTDTETETGVRAGLEAASANPSGDTSTADADRRAAGATSSPSAPAASAAAARAGTGAGAPPPETPDQARGPSASLSTRPSSATGQANAGAPRASAEGRPVPQPEVTVGIARPQANPARTRGQAADTAPAQRTVSAAGAGEPAAPPPVPVARALPADSAVPVTGNATVTAATGAGTLSRAEDVTSPRAEAPSRVSVRALERSWVQIRDGDGDIVFSRILAEGETYRVPGGAGRATMITGNAGGVVLVLDGQQLPPLGEAGQVRRNIPLSPAALAGWQP